MQNFQLALPDEVYEKAHEELYLRWYGLLIKRALRLSGQDKASAEDLVHDVFVELALSRPDLSAISNLQGYVFTILQNIHYSRLRRSKVGTLVQLSIADYDSAGIGLRMMLNSADARSAADQHARVQARDELWQVCKYACLRKETSKIGSILIFRFFHGYYPDEIALLARMPRKMVYRWLQLARNEARLFLSDPHRLSFMEQSRERSQLGAISLPTRSSAADSSIEAMLLELQALILQAHNGKCFQLETLRAWYGATEDTKERLPIEGGALAHIVSCRRCLDLVNGLLGLAPLAERYLGDAVGKEDDVDDDWTDPNVSGGGGEEEKLPSEKTKRKFLSRVREVIEHRPRELYIAINGDPVCGQMISCDRSEQRLNLELNEIPQFIEILSEQGLRLTMVHLGGEVSAIYRRVALSEGRSVEVELSSHGSRPVLRVAYFDPLLKAEPSMDDVGSDAVALDLAAIHSSFQESWPNRLRSTVSNLKGVLSNWLVGNPERQVPAIRFAVAMTAAVLVASLVFWQLRRPARIMAAPLLKRSIDAERAAAPQITEVIHRTLHLEERAVNNKAIITRRLVEIWQGAQSSPDGMVRRVYDENNQLISGEWCSRDGSRTIYHRSAQPSKQLYVAGSPVSLPADVDSAWQIDLSASNFMALLTDLGLAMAEETAETHIINWQPMPSSAPLNENSVPRLISATLILTKANLRPVEQQMIIQRANDAREYRFIEIGFNRYPRVLVPPTVFKIDPELLPAANGESVFHPAPADHPASVATPETSLPINASLEVKVIYLLSQENITLGERAVLKRMPDGILMLELTVDDQEHKESIMQTLAPVINERGLKVEIRTRDEKIVPVPSPSPPANAPGQQAGEQDLVAGARLSERFPELRDYVLRRLGQNEGAQDREPVENKIKQTVTRLIEKATRAKSHALALKHTGGRFSPAQLGDLDAEARRDWWIVLSRHAAACENETSSLRQEFETIFSFSDNGDPSEKGRTLSLSLLSPTIEQLVKLTAANETALRGNFIGPRNRRGFTEIRSQPFFRSLHEIESLAASIRKLAESQP